MIKFIYIFCIGAGLLACSSVSKQVVHTSVIKLDNSFAANPQIDGLIQPFKDSLAKEMNVIIGQSPIDFQTSRPNGSMNNWMADALFTNQTENVRLSEPVLCLLNVGGIRASFNKGPVTVGDVYKVMPFDNELVWVKLPISALKEIESYLIASGGEPIANAQLEKGVLQLNGVNPSTAFFWVITSDYLMNGGDKMRFFDAKISVLTTNKLLRTAIIEEVKKQGVLNVAISPRITF